MNIRKPKKALNDGDIVKTRTCKYRFNVTSENRSLTNICSHCAASKKRVLCRKYKCYVLDSTSVGLLVRQGFFEKVE